MICQNQIQELAILVSLHSGHHHTPPHPTLPCLKGGFEIQAEISKREGLKNFWIKGRAFPKREG